MVKKHPLIMPNVGFTFSSGQHFSTNTHTFPTNELSKNFVKRTYKPALSSVVRTHLLVSDDLLHVSLRVINGKASGDQWRSFR